MDKLLPPPAAAVKSPRWCLIGALAAALLTVLGAVAATAGVAFIDGQLRDGLRANYVLDSPAAGEYAKWVSSDAPGAALIYTSFYVYNVTNPWDVVHSGAKPNVTEVGPLTYRFQQQKFNVSWDADDQGDVVSFAQWEYYVAADDVTAALERAVVTTLYVPLLGALANPAAQALLAFDPVFSKPMALWTNRSVHEALFGWERDPLLLELANVLHGLPTTYPGLQANDSTPAQAIASHGISRAYTGAVTTELAREFVTWDGMDEMFCGPYGPCGDATSGCNTSVTASTAAWATREAQQVRGTKGDQFHQFVSPSDTLHVGTYSFGVYRHWELASTGSYGLPGAEDVSLLRFQWQPGTLGNASVDAEQAAAYYNNGPSGLLNLSTCYWGAPVFLSKPLFLDGSDELHAGLTGLGAPDRAKHDTWLGVEPTSGQTLDFHWRIAANVHIEPIDGPLGFKFFPGLAPVYMPVMWADRYATADEDQVALFKGRVYYALDLIQGAKWGGLAAALVGGLALLAFAGTAWQRSRAQAAGALAQLQLYETLLGAREESEAPVDAPVVASAGQLIRNGPRRAAP